MKLGLTLGYSGAHMYLPMDLVLEAEKLGFDSVWSAEAWGSDAVSPLAWIGAKTSTIKLGTAIMQMPGRSPANTAMTAMTLDALSGGRFILGLGTSGPQVVEGWHGRPFHKTLTWMREYITIVRTILQREEHLRFDGVHYQLPYEGPNSTHQGKSLKSILHGRPDIPIFTGSMAPKSQQLSAELGDGCILTCMNPERPEVLEENFSLGLERAGKTRDQFELCPSIAVGVGPAEFIRPMLKKSLALYIGGMGSRKKNFYKDYVCKVGFEAEAHHIQDLYLDGKKKEAIAAVPDAMVDTFHLVGSPEQIRDRLEVWKESGTDTLLIGCQQIEAIRLLGELNS